ncbi:MAG: hypothetical protein ABI440_06740 [Casimicrobiaceae bacterium]
MIRTPAQGDPRVTRHAAVRIAASSIVARLRRRKARRRARPAIGLDAPREAAAAFRAGFGGIAELSLLDHI